MYSILWFKIQYQYYVLLLKLFQLWPLRAPSGLLLSSFNQPPDVPGSSCVFQSSPLQSTMSSRNPGSFRWRMVFGDQDVSITHAPFYWGIIASRCSHQTGLGNTCMCTNPGYMHVCISVSIYYIVVLRDESEVRHIGECFIFATFLLAQS